MMYVKFLKSLLWHKWYVFLAGRKIGVPIWRLIIHDWQKFAPLEFKAYAQNFFADDEFRQRENNLAFEKYSVAEAAPYGHYIKERFAYAWLHHENTAPHHWGYWIRRSGEHAGYPLPMPRKYIYEMVADWMGASKAYTGSWDMTEWLDRNLPNYRDKMHIRTRHYVGEVLARQDYNNISFVAMDDKI